MMSQGRVPRTDLPAPHAAVSMYVLELQERNVDLTRVFGPMISEPVCEQLTASCVQWSVKSKFLFPQGARSTTQVQLAPLGQNRMPQHEPIVVQKPVPWQSNTRLVLGYILALVFIALGMLALLAARNLPSAQPPLTTPPPAPVAPPPPIRRGRL
jgi:hypothetical protein